MTNQYDGQKRVAVSLLNYYLSQDIEAWDSDNDSEIEKLVDALVDAATAPLLERIEALETRLDDMDAEADRQFTTTLYSPIER